jgi:hypothetical protein
LSVSKRVSIRRRSIGASVSVSKVLSGFSPASGSGAAITSTRFSVRMP